MRLKRSITGPGDNRSKRGSIDSFTCILLHQATELLHQKGLSIGCVPRLPRLPVPGLVMQAYLHHSSPLSIVITVPDLPLATTLNLPRAVEIFGLSPDLQVTLQDRRQSCLDKVSRRLPQSFFCIFTQLE